MFSAKIFYSHDRWGLTDFEYLEDWSVSKRSYQDHPYSTPCIEPPSQVAIMGKLIPNAFNLLVVIAVALGSTGASMDLSTCLLGC
jgi:hypothetical protein